MKLKKQALSCFKLRPLKFTRPYLSTGNHDTMHNVLVFKRVNMLKLLIITMFFSFIGNILILSDGKAEDATLVTNEINTACVDPLTEISFAWSYITFPGHLGFKLYYSTNDGPFVLLKVVDDPIATATIITDHSLHRCDNTYHFRLIAYSKDSDSDPSELECIGVECSKIN